MYSHIMVGSNDIARSKKFYDALFTAMGAQPATEDARGRLAYSHNGSRFMVTQPIDGKPASQANGGTIGFVMKDAAQAEAWHKAGVANGGTSIEDRLASAQMGLILPIFVIPMATSWSELPGRLPHPSVMPGTRLGMTARRKLNHSRMSGFGPAFRVGSASALPLGQARSFAAAN